MALEVIIKRCNLRYWRQKAGYTQLELAHLAGLREATISTYENGIVDMRISTAVKLATLCGCSVEDLYELEIRRR